jgi:glyoxylase-like metal-dependent hydrolase (beta-lactamase superfamily II)
MAVPPAEESPMTKRPLDAGTAELHVLTAGYIRYPENRVASTVSFVRDGDFRLVIDPGLVVARSAILDPLAELGVSPDEVTDVVFSHHHPDHTLNAALFPHARFHDHWATYQGDVWIIPDQTDRDLSRSVRLIATPGHTPQDITTLVSTPDGVAALTHLWFSSEGPPEDPVATDPEQVHENRARILDIAGLIVPGHGPAFTPGPETPH